MQNQAYIKNASNAERAKCTIPLCYSEVILERLGQALYLKADTLKFIFYQ
ncbi:hypothetical protein QE357_003956 [Siphonobacter sp. BAB-5404]|nr:hypothetical protein [Siphonobacter sp. SORGH_AS_0500]